MPSFKGGFTGLVSILSQFLQKLKGRNSHRVFTSIRVNPLGPLSFTAIGQTRNLTAAAYDQTGQLYTPTPVLTWSSSNQSIGQLGSAAGGVNTLTSRGVGTAAISVSSGSIRSQPVTIAVQVPPPDPDTRIINLTGSLDFGNSLVGTTPTRTLTISNSGNQALTVTSLSYPTGFTGAFSGIIAASGSHDVTVTFTPLAATTYSGMVSVTSDATSGTATTTASGTGTVSNTRIIGLSGTLDFGTVVLGSPHTRVFTISNTGSDTLTVSSINYPTGFTGAYAGTIAANGSQNVTVTFTPVAAISYGGTVTVNSDKTSGTNTVTASGVGTASAPTRRLLTDADLSFDGFVRMPQNNVDARFTYGGMSGRYVGGNLHLFFWGNGAQAFPALYEVNVQGKTPNTVKTSAPLADLYVNWGNTLSLAWQSYDAGCAPQIGQPWQALSQAAFWNPDTNLFYCSYLVGYGSTNFIYTVMAAALTGDPSSPVTTVYGPWRFQVTPQQSTPQSRTGARTSHLQRHPTTGKMLISGTGYSNTTKAWGPNLFGDCNWPTAATPGGCNSAFITVPSEYLEYYSPVGDNINSYNAWTGASNGPISQFQYPPSLGLTYPHQKQAEGGTRANPLVAGAVTASDFLGMAFLGWFQGAHTEGVLFSLTDAVSPDGDITHCSTAALDTYLNFGNGFLHLSSHSGSFAVNATITGQSSGTTANVTNVGLLASSGALAWGQAAGVTANFLVGETITCSAGGTGVIDEFHRNNTFVGDPTRGTPPGNNVGCACNSSTDLCATGPSTTWLTPMLAIYDPADLNRIKANTQTDYTTAPTSMVNLYASPFSVDVPHAAPHGPGLTGGWIDTTTNKLWIIATQADCSRTGNCSAYTEAVLLCFSINDVP